VIEHRFKTREQASIKVAEHISAAIERSLDGQTRASVVVSGGTSPVRCYAELSTTKINWSQIDVFLSDERWVAADHPASNEKLVVDNLRCGAAQDLRLHGVYRKGVLIEQRCTEIEADLHRLHSPFASVLLGMGSDGHFASLFPDLEGLGESLELNAERFCVPVRTAASEYPRISLTLSALCHSNDIVLLMFGDEKWQTYNRARNSADAYPVSRLLLQDQTPLHVYWAP
jgi:6-phosphogluconolactonase